MDPQIAGDKTFYHEWNIEYRREVSVDDMDGLHKPPYRIIVTTACGGGSDEKILYTLFEVDKHTYEILDSQEAEPVFVYQDPGKSFQTLLHTCAMFIPQKEIYLGAPEVMDIEIEGKCLNDLIKDALIKFGSRITIVKRLKKVTTTACDLNRCITGFCFYE